MFFVRWYKLCKCSDQFILVPHWPSLNLFKCLGKLRHEREEKIHVQRQKHQQQRRVQKSTHAALSKLLTDVQVMAKTLLWNKSYTTNPLKCNVLQIQHRHVLCVALRCWNRTWGMFLPSTWGLLKSWRNKASSCLNVWARPEMLFRIPKVMTFRVSVNSNTSISVHLYCLWIFVSPNTLNGSHSLITCTYTYIQSNGKVTWWPRLWTSISSSI